MKNFLLWFLEALETEHTQKTGTRATYSGVYRSEDEYIPLAKSERFPPSSTNEWTLVVKL